MGCSTMKEKKLKESKNKSKHLAPVSSNQYYNILVALMRQKESIEVKYNGVDEDMRLDESKEEETPLS